MLPKKSLAAAFAACALSFPAPAPAAGSASFAFQIPTYLVEKADASRAEYSCDHSERAECRLNLDLSPTFGGESESAWACSVDFGMGAATGEEAKCNPAAVTLTGASVTVRMSAWRKSAPADVFYREISIKVSEPSGSGVSASGTGTAIPATEPGSEADTGAVIPPPVPETPVANGGDSGAGGISQESGTGTFSGGVIPAPEPESPESFSGAGISGSGSVPDGGSGSAASEPAAGTGSASVPETGSGSSPSVPAEAGTGVSVPVADAEGSGSIDALPGEGSGSSIPVPDGGNASGSGAPQESSGSVLGTGAPVPTGSVSAAALSAPQLFPAVIVQSGLDALGVCKNEDCAVNFASSLSGSAYACSWDLGGGTFSSTSSSGSCNPSYARFPAGARSEVVLAVSRASDGAAGTARISVTNPFVTRVTERVVTYSSSAYSASVFPPVAKISLQGAPSKNRWEEYKSAGCVAETASGCAFNFDGRTSSVAEASRAVFSWDFGSGRTYSGQNPGPVVFPEGAWRVRLAVSDPYGTSSDEWSVEVTRPAPAEKSAAASAGVSMSGAEADWFARGYAAARREIAGSGAAVGTVPMPGSAAPSVRVSAQGPHGAGRSFSGGAYRCETRENSCSANFLAELSGTGKALRWEWDFGAAGTFSGANPPAVEFPAGTTDFSVTAFFAGGASSSATGSVRVVPPAPAAKKAKAAPKKKAVKSSVPAAKGSVSIPSPAGTPAVSSPVSPFPAGAADAPVGWMALAASGASGLSWVLSRKRAR